MTQAPVNGGRNSNDRWSCKIWLYAGNSRLNSFYVTKKLVRNNEIVETISRKDF